MVRRRHARATTEAATPYQSTPREPHGAIFTSPLSCSICVDILPNFLVIVVAFTAVWFELTTSAFYSHSSQLQISLKRSFIIWICLAVRTQLADFISPPQLLRRRQSLWTEATRHARALFANIAANLLGTTIIRPVFGAAPQFEETIRLVIPLYFLVEMVIDGLRFPLPLLKAIVGLSVSWLKAITIPKLVMDWQSDTNAHPFGFLAISTANLYASSLVLRYLINYTRTNRLVDFSVGTFGFFVQIVGTSAIVGIIAHLANYFHSDEERILEARFLYFCVACFALDKYWKKAVRELLLVGLSIQTK